MCTQAFKMNKIVVLLCFLCLVLHTQFQNYCAHSMVVNEIDEGGGMLAKMLDSDNAPHHMRHHRHHHHHHHDNNHQKYQDQSNSQLSESKTIATITTHSQPNMWTILGQTIKSDDSELDTNAKYLKELEQKQILQKINGVQSDGTNKLTENCPKCNNRPELRMTEDELTKLRIEYVKNQILQKLRLTERPNVSTTNIPKPVAEGATIFTDHEGEQKIKASEQFYGKTTQKIIFLQLDNEKCKEVDNFGSYMCFTFKIPADIDYRDVDAAELWVYKQPDPTVSEAHSFLVSEIENWDSKKINKPFAIHYANSSEGWGKIDFTWSIQNWIKYNNLYHIIDISCNTCEKHPTLDLFSLDNGYRPFIVVNTTSSQTIKRQRRSVNCSPGISECCRDKLYISFAEIGWDDWILHPAGYDAYFCRGSCASAATITSNASYYNLLVRKMMHQRNKSPHNKEKSLELVPCCTATQFSSLQLFYMETNTTATRKTLPNMVVEACGCM